MYGGGGLNTSTYIILMVIFILFLTVQQNKKAVLTRKIIKRRKMEGHVKMRELAKQFVGKECIICAFDSNHQFIGTIKEVSDGAMLIENNAGAIEVINLDFIIRIKEYPRNKKRKEKVNCA